MLDYEGSRREFLKLLAECGEEPAFLARARAPEIALDALLSACRSKRSELITWPAMHLAALGRQVEHDWSRLGRHLAHADAATLLANLHATLASAQSASRNWLSSDRAMLRRFVESAERFNRHWRAFLAGVDFESVNKPRREFNQYYLLEKSCAFGSDLAAAGFEPLAMICLADLERQFPLLELPALA